MKNLNASRPSEHPPVRGNNVKRLGAIIGCKDKTSSSTDAIAVRSVHDVWVLSNGMQYRTAKAGCVPSVLPLCSTLCDREWNIAHVA